MSAFQKALDRLKATRAWSAWQRYGSANGDLLAAGVAYFAFFSIFPALALAFAIFGFVLQGRPDVARRHRRLAQQGAAGHGQDGGEPQRHHQPDRAGEPDPDDHRHHRLRHPAAGRSRLGRRAAHRHPHGLRPQGFDRQRRDDEAARPRRARRSSGCSSPSRRSSRARSVDSPAPSPTGWACLVAPCSSAWSVCVAGIFFDTLIMVVLLRVLSRRPAALAQRPSRARCSAERSSPSSSSSAASSSAMPPRTRC